MYGDEGHDKIYGGDSVHNQYMFGGEGDDFIRGGDRQAPVDSRVRSLQYINGGEGDDRLLPGDTNGDITIRGGKGNDTINVYEG